MRILAVTDIHGSYDTLDCILSRESTCDVIIIGGDITTVGTPREVEETIQRVQSSGKTVLAVSGNMDPPELEASLDKCGVSINGKGVIVEGIGFFGVSAAPLSPLRSPNEISEEEIRRCAETGWAQVAKAELKVFVAHAPPHGTSIDLTFSGRNVGSRSVREFIERHQPDITICGHIHEGRGQYTIGKSRVINCGQAGKGYYGWIEIGENLTLENRSV